jgi:hypothetical protein
LRPAYSLRETAVFTRRRRVKVEFIIHIIFSGSASGARCQWLRLRVGVRRRRRPYFHRDDFGLKQAFQAFIGNPDGHPKGGRGVWGVTPQQRGASSRNPDGDPPKNPYFIGIPRNPDEITAWVTVGASVTGDLPASRRAPAASHGRRLGVTATCMAVDSEGKGVIRLAGPGEVIRFRWECLGARRAQSLLPHLHPNTFKFEWLGLQGRRCCGAALPRFPGFNVRLTTAATSLQGREGAPL